MLCIFFLVIFFSFLRRILYNTWKSYYKQLELLYKLKKALMNVSSIAHSKNNSFWVLHQELLLMNVSKTVCRSALVLLWLRTIGKAMKTLRFHNNTHSLDQSIISSQCVIQRHIQNSSKHLRWSVLWKQLATLTINCFRKTLYFRYFRGLWIRLCHL